VLEDRLDRSVGTRADVVRLPRNGGHLC
jgi:hypothetical protein